MTDSVLNVIYNFIKKGRGGEEAKRDLNQVDKAQEQAEESSKKFSLAQIAVSAAVTSAGISFVKALPGLIQLGFQYNNAKTALSAYVGSTEEAENVTRQITAAAGFAITEFEAMQNATRLVSLGLASNAKEAARLTKTAITLGATMGKDVSGAFEEFSLLLANESILRLDTFGISGAKVREEMARLAAEFPDLDRNARFTNATLTIAEEKMQALEEAGFEATSSIDRFGARLEEGKIAAAKFFADGLLPIIDGFFALDDAVKKTDDELIRNSDTFEDLQRNLEEAGRVGGFFGKQTILTNEALFNQAKAAQAAADANAEFVAVEEEVALTLGGVNQLLTENETLQRALSLAISGPLTGAFDKWRESVTAANAAVASGAENAGQLIAASNDLRSALEKTTAELIFQAAAQDLNAEAALLLARELGLVDEATFAVAQEAQRLRIGFDEGKLSAEQFASEVGILRDDINSLTSKNVIINAETLAANRNVASFTRKLAGVPRSITTRLNTIQSFISRGPGGTQVKSQIGFQEGGQFTIPERGPLGDNVPVAFNAERGETVTITPRDGSPPAGAKGGVNIGNINVADPVTMSQLTAILESRI